jgi:hypothetical protein
MSRVAFPAGGGRKGFPTRNRSLRFESLERRELLATTFHVLAGGTFSANVDFGALTDLGSIHGTIATSSTVTLNPAVDGVEHGTFDFKGNITIKETIYGMSITLVNKQPYEIKGTFDETVPTETPHVASGTEGTGAGKVTLATGGKVTATATSIVAPAYADEFLKLLGGSLVSTGMTNTTSIAAGTTQTVKLTTLDPSSFDGFTIVGYSASFKMSSPGPVG